MVVSVADSGIGGENDALPCLFDRLYRANEERYGADPGLAVVQEIVEARGGKIGVRSQARHGIWFTIHPPFARK